MKDLKIAIIHDFLTTLGGAERVLMALHQLYPQAPIYTLRYDADRTNHQFAQADVRVARLGESWLRHFPFLSLPFLPNAIETLPLSSYDLVISSSAGYAKGVITKPTTLHISYCHTPLRYIWDWTNEYAQENGFDRGIRSIGHRLITHYLRIWDQASALRVDCWLANSENVKKRIDKYYRQPSTVIYPPVSPPKAVSAPSPVNEPYFLIISRLSPYKKIDMAIEACAQTNSKLIIIGEGADRKRLETLAKRLNAPASFLGYQSDEAIGLYYANCQAFLFTGEDDFGITPVEAMSYGKPVIAYGKGGVLETIIDGKTGLFFNEPTAKSLTAAILRFNETADTFSPKVAKDRAKLFSENVFDKKIKEYIETEWAKFTNRESSK